MKPTIKFPDFEKLDLRVGQITKVEDHPNADKLYVLTVNFGEEIGERNIIAGIKLYYEKEELENKKAIFIINLEPITLRGVESNGMILASGNEDKTKVVFLTPEKDLEIGSRVS